MVIPTITFANSSSVSDYVDPSFQDYLRNGQRRVPLKRPEFLKLVYLNCRNQAITRWPQVIERNGDITPIMLAARGNVLYHWSYAERVSDLRVDWIRNGVTCHTTD